MPGFTLGTPATSPQRTRFGASPGGGSGASSVGSPGNSPPAASAHAAGRAARVLGREGARFPLSLVTSPAGSVSGHSYGGGLGFGSVPPSRPGSIAPSGPSSPTYASNTPPPTSANAAGTPLRGIPVPGADGHGFVAVSPVTSRGLGDDAASSLNTATRSMSAPASAHPAAAGNSPLAPGTGLLVPTDRPLEEFETQWLPRLGHLRVDREVEMRGYALYGIRSWYLSRTHWAFTIAAYTGKPTDVITCYVLVPAPELSASAGTDELAAATAMLAGETRAKPRKTDEGTLLVSAPAAYGQEIWPIPQGDLREAWPFVVLNTALRRLGCGGRAAMGNDIPVAAVRRKFYESYHIPVPEGAFGTQTVTTPAGSPPPQSPVRTHPPHGGLAYGLGGLGPRHPPSGLRHARSQSTNSSFHPRGGRGSSPSSPSRPSEDDARPGSISAAALERDPLMLSTVDLVKLIQGALAIWGYYGHQHVDIELDGLFCDETKAGLFKWRTAMGMDREESLKLEKATSGGCIDPRTLAALLSSITSVRYQLGVIGVEKLPKDPFGHPRRFLNAWRAYQTSAVGKAASPFLTVDGIRQLNACFLSERKGHAADALKVHKLLLSGVANAASGVSATLKGGGSDGDSMPAWKREQHHHHAIHSRGNDDGSGVGMIVPEGKAGGQAAPDVITTDLDSYVRGVLKSREKDWDAMGARRVAELWNGQAAEVDDSSRNHSRLRVFSRRSRQPMLQRDDDDDDSSVHLGTSAMGTIRGAAGAAAGAASDAIKGITKGAKGGLSRVGGRRQTADDTSDSESGKARSLSHAPFNRRVRSAVPLLIEPNASDADTPDHDTLHFSRSPSPLPPGAREHSPMQSMRLSVLTNNTNANVSDSEGPATAGGWDPRRRRSVATMSAASAAYTAQSVAPSHAVHGWAARPAVIRTASEGADVAATPQGNEWIVTNGHGTGRRPAGFEPAHETPPPQRQRSHSLQDRSHYRGVHVSAPEHLAVDVEMCHVVWKLRKREKQLKKRAEDMAALERSAFVATQAIFDTARLRRDRIEELEKEVRALRGDLGKASVDAVDDDRALQWASSKLLFFLSEDCNTHELSWQLRELEKHYEAMQDEIEKRTDEAKKWTGGRAWDFVTGANNSNNSNPRSIPPRAKTS